ncbi:hypothetical protein C2S51_038125 [Perilla frutescens var. frutescens]|nr:hypothetical protein C2S51_038125 [Perilla frutescens var. frutescens]
MENGLEKEIYSDSPKKVPELTWQRKLNYSSPLPKEYSVRVGEVLHMWWEYWEKFQRRVPTLSALP